jgi:hypothetical protein
MQRFGTKEVQHVQIDMTPWKQTLNLNVTGGCKKLAGWLGEEWGGISRVQ